MSDLVASGVESVEWEVVDDYSPALSTPPRADLVVTPHPLTLDGRVVTIGAELRPGETLAAFLTRAGVDLSQGDWVITIGGRVVPRVMWDRTRPHHGTLVECRRPVGKSALKVVALVALTYFTIGTSSFVAGGGFGGLLGFTGGAAFAVNFGAYMVGSMLINKLLPPTQAKGSQYKQETGSTYSLTGARNRARPFETLGLVFGSVKVVPDYAAQPFSWFEGEDQYLYCRFQAGINAGSVSGLKVGETDIAAFTDVAIAQSGFPGTTTQLEDWSNVDTIAGGALTAPTAPGSYVTRTSSTASVRLAVDIGVQLYDMASDGKFNATSVSIELERRLLPSGAWGPFSGGSATVTFSSKSTKPIRRTIVTDALAAGQYEVRARKMTADVATTSAANTVEWGSLKSYQLDSGAYAGYPQVGIKIRATGQLSGSLDELSWVLQSADAPVWNGSAFVTGPTSNPGAQMLQFARGIYDTAGRLVAGLGLPDAQIDVDGFKAFTLHCAAQGYRFDHYFDSQVSCYEVLEAMAAAGLGSVSHHPGKLSVVWATSSDPVEAVVNMGNIKAGTFRVDYATRSTAEELEVTCFDRDDGWKAAAVRVLAPGVTVPRETARYAPLGITNQAGLIRTARQTMAQNLYQRKSVAWEMDLEALTFRRYSVIALSHDLTQWGYGGRLHSAVNGGGSFTMELDAEVPWGSGGVHKIGIRVPGETGYRIFDVAAFSGTVHVLTVASAWPGGVPFPGDAADNPAHDYLWIYDFKATPGTKLRVTAIEPAANLGGAKITAVPELDEFWTYMASGTYTVPPPPPGAEALVVSNLAVTQERVALTYDNATDLTVTFDAVGPFDHAQVWAAVTGEPLQLQGETRTRSFGPRRVTPGSFDIEVRPFDQLGRAGTKGTITHVVTLDTPLSAGGASLLTLSATGIAFIFEGATATTSTSPTITLTAVLSNATGTATFVATAYDAAGASLGTLTLGGSGNTRTLSSTLFNSLGATTTRYVTIVATLGSLTDQVTVFRGDNGTSTLTMVFGNEFAPVPSASDGSSPVFTNANTQYIRMYEGVNDVTALWTWARADTSCTSLINGVAGPVSGTGTVNVAVSAMSADQAKVAITATRSGYPSQTRDFRLAKVKQGNAGTAGLNTLIVFAYQRSASGAPALPSVAASYDFTTKALTGLNNGWSDTVPAGTNPLYVTGATASSATTTDSIAAGEWSAAQLLAQSGVDGLNSATVTLYQRSASATALALPNATLTYTFSTGLLSGAGFNGWSQTIPSSGGAYLHTTLATAIAAATASTDNILTSEWSADRVLAQDGAGGTAGARGSLTGYSNSVSPAIYSTAPWNGATDDTNARNIIWQMLGNGGSAPDNSHLRIGDTVTLKTSGSTASAQKFWSGSAWIDPGTVISGNLLVGGTISGSVNLNIQGSAIFAGTNAVTVPSDTGTLTGITSAAIGNTSFAANSGFVGLSSSASWPGVYGYNSNASGGPGVFGFGRYGVFGRANGAGTGVYGSASATTNSTAVYGETGGSGTFGVVGATTFTGGGTAVKADASSGGTALQVVGISTFSGQLSSTLATGTAPFNVTSTTVCPNLNVSQLLGGTWAVPGAIGSTTPNTGAFTSISVTSTSQVNNLNAQYLQGRPVAASGAWFPAAGSIPFMASDGVMEAGRYIDFHSTNTETIDYGVRLELVNGSSLGQGYLRVNASDGASSNVAQTVLASAAAITTGLTNALTGTNAPTGPAAFSLKWLKVNVGGTQTWLACLQ